VCDRIGQIHDLDWFALAGLKNLTHFSMHEHFRTKTMMKEYIEMISEVIQGRDLHDKIFV
jgi:hypothetical protein